MNRDDETVCTACRSGVCPQHQPPERSRRNLDIDAAFDLHSAALVKAVAAAPGGDSLACVSLAYDMRTGAWMINSNIKAEGFLRFLESALTEARRNMAAIQGVSDALDRKEQREN